MSERTGIPWCHHTFNIAWGCENVSPGCAHCYAKVIAEKFGHDVWGPKSQKRRTFGWQYWAKPLDWNRKALEAGERRRVFCSSMADVFEQNETIDVERHKLWPLIRETPQLDWLLLTKRAERIRNCLPMDWGQGYPNVWLGVSVENNRFAYRAARLCAIPAVVRFISAEPLLGSVGDLDQAFFNPPPFGGKDVVPLAQGIDWVIAGGESGPDRREMSLDDFIELRTLCRVTHTAFFAKQDSAHRPDQRGRIPDEAWVREFPTPRRIAA